LLDGVPLAAVLEADLITAMYRPTVAGRAHSHKVALIIVVYVFIDVMNNRAAR
jgi:hypothetical protein